MIRRFLSPVLLGAILLLGLALRLAPWGQNRFLEDEALYAAWGLQIATGADPMLDGEPVDKPPFHPYVLAASLWLSGSTEGGRAAETAARLPSLLASVASIALVYALARALYPAQQSEGGPLLAALLLALSPFDVLFASTAFTDPLLVALGLGALLAAARGKAGTAGLLAGLA
ncbi:MAG TPA: glycosyltransferase family 39 protein, partial [Anaerolineae bacterium]|nr:glycosyltransferase family 39 protein [Anaerolineae bacterium]